MGMLADFREAVWEGISTQLPGAALHPEIPDDLAELPCIVVGFPEAIPDRDGTYGTTVEVYAIVHPAETPGRDSSLMLAADAIFDALGGTSGMKVELSTSGEVWHLRPGPIARRDVTVGERLFPAYLLTIESAYITC